MIQNFIGKLALNTSQSDGSCQIFISEVDEYLGQLIILAEVNQAKDANKKIIKQIIDETKDHYFNSVANDSEKALEDALQKINFSLSETIKQTGKDWLDASNIVIISVNQQGVHFSKIGAVSAFLVSGKEMITITERNVDEEVNPVKIFANIYSGVLADKSTILFLTDNILDYISQDKLRKLTLKPKTKETISELINLLKKTPKEKIYGLTLIKRDEDTKDKNDSKIAVSEPIPEPLPEPEPRELKEERVVEPAKSVEKKIIAKKSIQKSQAQKTRRFKTRKLPSLKILLIAVAIIILVSVSIWIYKSLSTNDLPKDSRSEEIASAETKYQVYLNNIQTKFIEAQSLLISDQRDAARIILINTIQLIEDLPATTTEQKAQKISLAKKVATQLLLAEGVDLTSPELVQELTTPPPHQIILKENKIYILSALNSQIQEINLDDNVLIQLETISQEVGALEYIIDHSGAGLIFYHSLDGLARLDLDSNNITQLEWNRTWNGSPIASDMYQNKLYVISTDGKLLKYSNSITGFTQELEWLKTPSQVSLTGVIDMAIDGSVWLLKNTGEIIKLFRGEREEFSAMITPALQGPTRLFTDLDLKYLYILDPPTRRIVIVDKEGNLIKQFTSQEFTDISDMAVDEANGKIYLLDETRILEILF